MSTRKAGRVFFCLDKDVIIQFFKHQILSVSFSFRFLVHSLVDSLELCLLIYRFRMARNKFL